MGNQCAGCGRLAVAICERCLGVVMRDGAAMIDQFQRLVRRGIPVDKAAVMMHRRIDRYFRNGTLVALGRLSTD